MICLFLLRSFYEEEYIDEVSWKMIRVRNKFKEEYVLVWCKV